MPSTPTEAKHTPWRVSLPTKSRQHTVLMFDTYGRLVASSSWHDSSPYYPTKAQSIDNFERIAAAINERPSLLSLIEDMAKALERLGSNEAFDVATPELSDEIRMRLDYARAAHTRYTEFLRALSAQEGSTNA